MKALVAALFLLCATALAFKVDVQMKLLKGEVDASSTSASVPVVFRFTNLEDETITFLKWNTPLESQYPVFKSPFLSIRRKDDASISAVYLGIIINRRASMDDFVTIPAGGSIEVNFDLMKGYAFTSAGLYEVALTTSILARRGEQLYQEIANDVFDISSLTEITLSHGSMPIQVTRASAEIHFGGESEVNATTGAVNTKSCTTTQTSDIQTAGANAVSIATTALNSVKTTGAGTVFKTWFGSGSLTTVQNTYTKAQSRLSAQTYIVDCNGPSCSANTYAYVYPTDSTHTIYVCGVFWKVSANKCTIDSRPGTLVHEMSHFNDVGGTQDYSYGTSACQNLAKSDPAKAVRNADNYEYFAESCPSF